MGSRGGPGRRRGAGAGSGRGGRRAGRAGLRRPDGSGRPGSSAGTAAWAARSATVRVDPAVAELGRDRGRVQPTLRPTLGDRPGQGRVVDQPDPFQPVERLGDRGRLEAAVLQPLPQLGPGPGPGREQPQGGGVGGVRSTPPARRPAVPLPPAAPAWSRHPPPPDHHRPALRSSRSGPGGSELVLVLPLGLVRDPVGLRARGGDGGGEGRLPSWALIFSSISRASSGLSRRKLRAFSRPWPSWSPS